MKKLILPIIGALVIFNIGKLKSIFEREESDVFTEVETSSTSGAAQTRGPRATGSPNVDDEIELSLFDFDEIVELYSGSSRDELIERFNREPLQSQSFYEGLTSGHPIDRALGVYNSRWRNFVNYLELSDADRNQLRTMLIAHEAQNIELRNMAIIGEISEEEYRSSRRSLEELVELLSPLLSDNQIALFWEEKERQSNQLNQQLAEWNAQSLENNVVGILEAASRNDMPTLQAYIDSGADVNEMTRDGSYSPLQYAASIGNAEMAQMLLTAGANPNIVTTDGYENTPLRVAVRRGNIEIIRALAAAGADLNFAALNSPDLTPLATAALYGQTDATLTLLELGADATGTAGARALTNAIRYGGNEMEQALLEAGANPDDVLVRAARELREVGRRLGVVND